MKCYIICQHIFKDQDLKESKKLAGISENIGHIRSRVYFEARWLRLYIVVVVCTAAAVILTMLIIAGSRNSFASRVSNCFRGEKNAR